MTKEQQIVHIYIIRHGETEENKMGIIQGQLNTKLKEMGLDQAEKVAEAMKDACLGVAFSSDLDRASETARVILKYHPGVILHKQAMLRERNMGELQGLRVGTRLGRPPTGIESPADFMRRAAAWWKDAIIPYIKALDMSQLRGNVLVTTHGGFIGVLIRTLLDVQQDVRAAGSVKFGRCYNSSVTVIEVDRESLLGKLVKYSDISHLTRPVVQDNADVEEN